MSGIRASFFALAVISSLLVAATPHETANAQETSGSAKWTFMVYMDADNNLEPYGVEDFNEMEIIGSTEEVTILVQMDRIEEYDTTNGDWTDARRFKVEKDEDTSTISSPELMVLGEANMGDPEVLIDFARWAITNYPAERYAIVLWDHGGAFRGICYDDTVPGSDTYDMINMSDLHYSMQEIYQIAGSERIDLVGFDACLMAQLAVLYELKDFAYVAAASGYNEPDDGWPYDEILGPLTADPDMDPKALAKIVSREYIYSYNNGQEDPQDYPMVTMSGFDLTRIDDLLNVLDQFSEELASKGALGSLEYLTQIYLARKNCNSYDAANVFIYDTTGYPLYDIIDFTKKLENYIADAFPKNTLILDLCREVRSEVGSFMFYSERDQWHPDANGLSEYFPNKDADQLTLTQLPTKYQMLYEDLGFSRDHLWDDFLHAYYGIDPIEDSRPTIQITKPEFNTSFTYEEEVASIWGVAYDREMVDSVEVRVDDGDWTVLPAFSGPGKIVWFHQVPLKELAPGAHIVWARAMDRPIDGATPGQATDPVSTQIFIVEPEKAVEEGFKVPPWFLQVTAVLMIIAGILLGAVLFRGRIES